MFPTGIPVAIVIGLVSIAVALALLTPWALLAFGVLLFAIGAWDLP